MKDRLTDQNAAFRPKLTVSAVVQYFSVLAECSVLVIVQFSWPTKTGFGTTVKICFGRSLDGAISSVNYALLTP